MKNYGKYFILILFLIIIFREMLFKLFVHYEFKSYRKLTTVPASILDKDKKVNSNNIGVDIIIEDCLKQTAHDLNFTFSTCSSNPIELKNTHKANCIGYAQYFTYLFNKNASSLWQAKPAIGEIMMCKINLNKVIKHPFFKEHDFVIISNLNTGEKFAIDPVVYDYFHIKNINF